MHHVAVGDHVLLAFEPEFPGFAGAGLTAELDVVIVGDGFGADEAAFEVGVDHAGSLRSLGAARHRPGSGFLGASGEIGDEADPAKGTIAYVSPVARALIGKRVGDTVRAGNSDAEIVAIK